MPDYFGPDRTAVHVLRHQVQEDPDRVWIREGKRPFTVREMDARSDIVARGLAAAGVAAGSPVLVMLPNEIEFIECWLALAKLHAIQVPVNTAYFGQMLLHIVRDSGAHHIIIHAEYAPALAALAPELGSHPWTIIEVGTRDKGDGEGVPGQCRLSWEALLHEGAASAQPLPALPAHSDIAAIMYASGTTGASKGVMVTHAHSYQYAAGDNSLAAGPRGRLLRAAAPVPHRRAVGQSSTSCLIRGAAAVIKRKFSITDFWTDVEHYGVTTTFMLGAMGSMLYRATEGARHTSLSKVLMSPLIPEYRESLRAVRRARGDLLRVHRDQRCYRHRPEPTEPLDLWPGALGQV
jgi:crotonobetaine/carnitine-CoA ligase